MLLMRAHIEAVPNPTLRTSVGNSSLEKTYTHENVTQMNSLPSIANVTVAA